MGTLIRRAIVLSFFFCLVFLQNSFYFIFPLLLKNNSFNIFQRLFFLDSSGFFSSPRIIFCFLCKEAVTPDENYHLSLIQLHAHSWKIHPSHVSETEALGEIEHTPYLYHFFMGKIIHIFPFLPVRISVKVISFFFLSEHFFLPIAYSNVFGKGYISILALGIFSHLLGYIYLSGSVSYDILLTFCYGSIFCLIRFHTGKKRFLFFFFVSVSSLGSISKITFLPLTAIGGLFLLDIPEKQFFKKKVLDTTFPENTRICSSRKQYLIFSLCTPSLWNKYYTISTNYPNVWDKFSQRNLREKSFHTKR